MDFIDILKDIMIDFDLNQSQFAEKIGLKRNKHAKNPSIYHSHQVSQHHFFMDKGAQFAHWLAMRRQALRLTIMQHVMTIEPVTTQEIGQQYMSRANPGHIGPTKNTHTRRSMHVPSMVSKAGSSEQFMPRMAAADISQLTAIGWKIRTHDMRITAQ